MKVAKLAIALLAVSLILPATTMGEVIEIGVVLPLSGRTSHFGTEALRGINLAVEEINTRDDIKGGTLHLIVTDNGSDPTATAQHVSELIEKEGVTAVIGPITSTNSAAAAAVAQQGKTPLILPTATSPYVTEIGEYISRICFTDQFQSKILTEYSRDYLRAQRAAVIFEKGSTYSEHLAEYYIARFKDMGGSIVFAESFTQGEEHGDNLVERALQEKPDLIFAPVYYPEAALLIKQIDALNSSVTLLGGDGWESAELIRLAGDHVHPGQIYISSHFSLQLLEDKGSTFLSHFRQRYGDAPNAVSALAYDAVQVLADALRRATVPGRDGLQQALVSTNGFVGVTGKITINEKRNVVKDVYMLKVLKDGFAHEATMSPF
jgi:branched-chain amino acid transport system substrate-binding protein